MTGPTSNMQPSVEDEQSSDQQEIKQQQQQHADQQEQPTPTPITSGDDAAMPTPSPPAASDSKPLNPPPPVEPHHQTAEILKQVEFYFSDENLPHDAHLLSKTGLAGTGWVSINEILSWKKMRSFKPPARVKASLCLSKELIVWKNKFIRRQKELNVPITVKPREDVNKERNKELVEKPWLTKGILKPTGFEKTYVEPVLTPEEHEQARKLFDPELDFTSRIENAVARYMSKRKMHQLNLQIFTRFLKFGGFSSGPHQFTGGLTDKDMKEMELDSEQIAQMKSQFAVSTAVLDGFDPDANGETDAAWVVDFEGMAKAFLSSHFMAHFDWREPKTAETACTMLCNFYNYLLFHNVCPEYKDQIFKAREVCAAAEKEFKTLTQANASLPGNFNIACSTLCDGHYARIRPSNPDADWVLEEDKTGLSDEQARKIFATGIIAHGSNQTLGKFQQVVKQELLPDIVSDEEMGLEVVRVEDCAGNAKAIYDDEKLKDTIVKPTGKLHCIRWDLPHRPPKDLPAHVVAERKAKIGKPYEFIVEEETLKYCYPGLKLEGIVKELNLGIMCIDSIEYVYPSFFNWTLNEPYRDWKEPGPPKAWMLRQMGKESGLGEQEDAQAMGGQDDGEDEEGSDDDGVSTV